HVSGSFAMARDGTLAYLDGDPTPQSYLAVVAQDGTEQAVDSTWRGNFSTLALSPNGKHVAASLVTGSGEEHVWVHTIGSTQRPMRLTVGEGQYTTPTFTADGNNVLITRFAGDSSTFLSRGIDGSPEITLARGRNWVIESLMSRDGTWLVSRQYRAGERAIYAKRQGA